ncbi:undecaprenyldiphospho-muramoylpentapeptide beta-N-acetylglucosaminyltransferase [Crassaminicella thermophila]|uniref:UDP-N-acetylglucosamine--N-acetylmuramyl-(pentapeptide) pyrophosphoryl-undecaprenol N-acetylglucosamine transferase n=1 Tax=Crassaminicella thermophila TaxID=2599308 RepID=A0A5C0SBL3_CRATE|nr:undecaprenyldiphospho-muramoylpentapeptide beta-N-acetylglucosaminyltransferase [Crassaminicella thermophila]QEK11953.1 undecaprenyldiphospho-muramoylpentapeptide beta-N-acetylglucosaminyltransferase [Crassaminicella thermophila]
MKILISGGGTGGHIYPAIAIANKIKEEIKGVEILFVGTQNGLESKLVPNAGYKLERITVSGFKRSLSFDTVKSVRDLFLGIKDAIKIIKKFKPDLVIGTGGYVCGPIVFIASLLNIKTVIHEQNVIPGITNKILGKFVNKILVSFEESKQYFNYSNKIVVTGNPVRKDFIDIDKTQCRKALGIYDERFVIMSFGGSRGAEKINETMIEVLKKFNGSKDITIIHVTGSIHYEATLKKLNKNNFKMKDNIIVKEYIYDMSKYMGACDLVICRSGAITLAEITAMGLPAILIPSPYVTNNHQELNAKVLEKNGAAVLIPERELTDKNIVNLVELFLRDRNRIKEMANKSKTLAKPNATDIIYTNILNLFKL